VVTISEVIHRLELFVDDSDASFVSSASDLLDIGSGLALVSKLLVNSFCGFDGGLGVKFGCEN